MTIYNNSDSVDEKYSGKFVRSGEIIAIGPNNDLATNHWEIAERDGLIQGKNSIDSQTPEEADGGFLSISKTSEGKGSITITDTSTSLRLPTTEEARIKTRELFEKLNPGFEVETPPVDAYQSRERR